MTMDLMKNVNLVYTLVIPVQDLQLIAHLVKLQLLEFPQQTVLANLIISIMIVIVNSVIKNVWNVQDHLLPVIVVHIL